jgi:multidrug transporter EmrE-like cation transporter
MSGGGSNASVNKCGLTELLIFIAAILSGTACSICSKTMMELRGEGITGEEEVFQKPIFQTFGMFVGMMFDLVMHQAVVTFKIPFPGYTHSQSGAEKTGLASNGVNNYGAVEKEMDPLLQREQDSKASEKLPTWMYFFLAIPSIFDLAATALCMMGLQYIDVSIYQLLRGSGIIFVALMKQHVLGDHLFMFQWIGVFFNVTAVIIVGGTAILNESENDESASSGDALLGVSLVMAGAVVQAMQFVFEEKVMTMDIPSPPLLLIGMEGLWGTIFCVLVVYPLAYFVPGDDHGSYEDPWNTIHMFMNSSTIQSAFIVYFIVIFLYNFFAVLVTFLLNSVWHAILDNFRPITVWITDLFIFYVITQSGDFGEPWTRWGWLQVFGMAVLLYGTAVYNAPNAGSVRLEGKWYNFGFDFRKEYDEIEAEEENQALDDEWKLKQASFMNRKESSFFGERSPHISVHTQALRGLGTSHV